MHQITGPVTDGRTEHDSGFRTATIVRRDRSEWKLDVVTDIAGQAPIERCRTGAGYARLYGCDIPTGMIPLSEGKVLTTTHLRQG